MARNNLAPADLCVIGPWATETGAEDSLQSVNVAELADGALGLVKADGGSIFQLDKSIAIAAVAGSVVAPAAGGGNWLRVVGFEGQQYSVNTLLEAAVDLVTTANTWLSPAGATISYGLPAASVLFTLTPATGRLVYNGPTGKVYRIELLCSVANTAAAAAIRIAAAVSVAGDVTGTTDVDWQQETTTNATQDVPSFICATRDITLTNGDTIDPVFKNITDGTDIALQLMMMTLTPTN